MALSSSVAGATLNVRGRYPAAAGDAVERSLVWSAIPLMLRAVGFHLGRSARQALCTGW